MKSNLTPLAVLGVLSPWLAVTAFAQSPPPQPLVLKHRWSFNETGAASNGRTLADSVSNVSAVIRGNGATLNGAQVRLPGGASGSAPYVDLPNGLLSTRPGDATYEAWVTINGSQNWSRIFDFGSSLANGGNEINGPGGSGDGNEYLILSAQIGTTLTQNRFELRNGGATVTADVTVPYSQGQRFHVAVVMESKGGLSGGPRLRYYRNGVELNSLEVPWQLSEIKDNNCWLGRSNWTADANLNGAYDEMRVYDGAMAPQDVAASAAAGPDVATVPQPLHIDLFAAGSNSVLAGDSATLYWQIGGATAPLNVSITPAPGTVSGASGSVVVTPTRTTTYTLTASDATGSRTAQSTITVTPTVPVVNAQSLLVPYQGAKAVTLSATDPRSLPLTWSILTPPAHGTLTGTAPNLTYSAAAGYTGPDSILVQASNGAQAGQAEITFFVAAAAPAVDDQLVRVPWQSATPLTLTGRDPNGTALTWSILTPPAHGTLSGTAPALTYTPAAGYSGPDSFTFQASDGTFPSLPGTITLDVCPLHPPTDILLSDSSLKTDDAPGTMIARLQAGDLACGETHTFALVTGAGDTNNADFTLSGNQLLSNRDFSSALHQTVSIRLRVTDSTGQSFEKTLSFTVGEPDLHVKLNEIYYNSPNNKIPAEFVELYNPFGVPVDMSGWQFTSGIRYTFPAGSILPANGYALISEDPATLQALYGVSSYGPWSGGLSSDGESVVLRDATGTKIDEVDYGISAPWPVTPNGDGPSLELANPALDNDLGGHWRASTAANAVTDFIPAGSTGWRYRPGSSAASAGLAWAANGFSEDGTWRTGQAPIGLFKFNSNSPTSINTQTGVTLRTQLVTSVAGQDMATFTNSAVESTTNFNVNYRSVYFRKTFDVTGPVPAALYLRVMHNDAAIVYLNGTEVVRFGFPDNAPAQPPTDFTGIYESANDPWSEIILTNAASLLTAGTNTLSIQGWAKDPRLRGGPNGQDDPAAYNIFDFSIDARLSTAGQFLATPGAANSTLTTTAGPAIRGVDAAPERPAAGQPVTVTARISDRQGLGNVELRYQVVAPGNFIPAELPRTNAEILANIVANPDYPKLANSAFEAGWISVPMTDSGGVSGDTAGDGTFTAIIPGQANRSLIRYRIFATDLAGGVSRIPAADDPQKNYALFVYDGVKPYVNGTATILPQDLETLPVYHWIMRPADFTRLLAYNTADQFANTPDLNVLRARRYYNFEGAMVYDGKVYDHVNVRLRGGNSRYLGSGKRHFRFRFPQGNAFAAKDNKGRPYPRRWEDMLFNKQFGNNGPYDWGLPYLTGAKLWGLQGVPTPGNHWIHFRVIQNANEAASPTTGDFYGLYQALEFPDGKNFLKARDLPDGNFYKMSDWVQSGEFDERYQASGAVDYAEDFDNIRYNMHATTPQADLEKFVNMPLWYRYNAVQEAIRHYDIFIEPTGRHRVKNLYWYFAPQDGNRLGQCWFMPYDWDASFGPNFNNGYDFISNALYNWNDIPDSPTWALPKPDRSPLRIQHRNAIRELRDLLFYRDQTSGRGPVDDILDDGLSVIGRFWQADYARWKNVTGATVADIPGGPPGKAADMLDFCFTGWAGANGPAVGTGGRAAYLDTISDGPDAGQMPATPAILYTGPAGYPLDGLTFQTSAFSDPQGSGDFGAVEWRAGEIPDPAAPAYDPLDDRIYEVTTVWTSGLLTTPATTVTIPAGALRNGHTYRVRARHTDSSGRVSHWSAPVELTTTGPDVLTSLQRNLILSEFLYKPAPANATEIAAGYSDSDFEFIELQNLSAAQTLDLTDVRFTKGVDFDFPAGTLLAPGARTLVVRNAAAFTSRYGAGLPVIGSWQAGQSLSNGGEQLKLSFGAGTAVHDLTYADTSPWPSGADAGGISLVYAGPVPPGGDPDPQADGTNWRAGTVPGGTPGIAEPDGFAAWLAANGQTDPAADPDGDGYSNLATYALGLDLGGTGLVAISLVPDAASGYFHSSWTRRIGLSGASWVPEMGSDLQTDWLITGIEEVSATPNGDGTETVVLRVVTPVNARARCFLRIRFTTP